MIEALTESEKEIKENLKAVEENYPNFVSFDSNLISQAMLKTIFLRKKTSSLEDSFYMFFHLKTFEQIDKLHLLDQNMIDKCIFIMKRLYCEKSGGFCPRVGSTPNIFSFVPCLSCIGILGTETAFEIIDRRKLRNFLLACKQPNGSFINVENEDCDMRIIYAAVFASKLLNLDNQEELFEGTVEYILSCQTYEGGFSDNPMGETHGGYTFCAVAALKLLNKLDKCDIDSLKAFLKRRFSTSEGGFNGRACKVADTCYTYWIGASLRMLHDSNLLGEKMENFFNSEKLIKFFKASYDTDKPGFAKAPGYASDGSHTCYGLSGLSALNLLKSIVPESIDDLDHCFNFRAQKVDAMKQYFENKD